MCHIYLPATDVIYEYLAAISPGVSYLVGGTLPHLLRNNNTCQIVKMVCRSDAKGTVKDGSTCSLPSEAANAFDIWTVVWFST